LFLVYISQIHHYTQLSTYGNLKLPLTTTPKHVTWWHTWNCHDWPMKWHLH